MDWQSHQHQTVPGLLRTATGHLQQVTPIELFFDLVYVFAITQLARHLAAHLTIRGGLDTLLLLLAVWWAWIYTAWITNWFDPDRPAVRIVLIATMLLSLVMSAALPEAFGHRGLLFAATYVTIQVGRSLFAVLALADEPNLRRNFERILVWSTACGVLWLAGGFVHAGWRELLWLLAAILDYAAPAIGFYTPGLGRSVTADWTIAGGHLAERCQAFLLIALGESVVDTGATFSNLSLSTAVIAAFVVAFVTDVALWWVYFARSAEAASTVIARSRDPGRLGRSAYTYFHLPMVAGIIVAAVGIERLIAHPTAAASPAMIAAVAGGPALYLAGHVLFKWAFAGHISRPRLLAIAVLALLAPLARDAPGLVVSGVAATIVVLVAVWDTFRHRTYGAVAAGRRAVANEPRPIGDAAERGRRGQHLMTK